MSDGFETDRSDGVLRFARPETRWLSTGWEGGFCRADAAYNCTVPEDWDPDDIRTDVGRRLDGAGFDATAGPALITGVDQQHASGAWAGPVTVVATVGLSNPATLRFPTTQCGPDGESDVRSKAGEHGSEVETTAGTDGSPRPGTVNLFVGTSCSLTDAGMANLIAIAAEARTATLLELAGFTGTTSDAIVIGCDPDGEFARYTGSATPVGRATRSCVRAAITASFRSRYAERDPPQNVANAEHGDVTTQEAAVFDP